MTHSRKVNEDEGIHLEDRTSYSPTPCKFETRMFYMACINRLHVLYRQLLEEFGMVYKAMYKYHNSIIIHTLCCLYFWSTSCTITVCHMVQYQKPACSSLQSVLELHAYYVFLLVVSGILISKVSSSLRIFGGFGDRAANIKKGFMIMTVPMIVNKTY